MSRGRGASQQIVLKGVIMVVVVMLVVMLVVMGRARAVKRLNNVITWLRTRRLCSRFVHSVYVL